MAMKGSTLTVALAAALIPNPDLLFLDEPFEGVDAVASLGSAPPAETIR